MNPATPTSTATNTVLVDAKTLMTWAKDGRKLVMLDCRFELSDPGAGEKAYAESHPEGAFYAHLDRDLSSAKGSDPRHPSFTGRHPLPDRSAFAATAGAWGIGPDTTVVCFDAHGAPYASRAWWLLRWLGHGQALVLDGGLEAWIAAEGVMTAAVPPKVSNPRPYPASATPAMPSIDATRLMQQLGQLRIVDARGADRFRGENEVLDPVAGHIPGATSRPFKDNLDPQGRFKSASVLREAWQAALGNIPAEAVVQQCGSGVTACQNMLAMMHAGFPATTLYAGSWSEWSADPARPRALG